MLLVRSCFPPKRSLGGAPVVGANDAFLQSNHSVDVAARYPQRMKVAARQFVLSTQAELGWYPLSLLEEVFLESNRRSLGFARDDN